MKFLGTKLVKGQNLYTENYKTLLEEIKGLNKWKFSFKIQFLKIYSDFCSIKIYIYVSIYIYIYMHAFSIIIYNKRNSPLAK